MVTEFEDRESEYIRPEERMEEGMLLWLSFWRANPHRMAMDYLACPLKPFQCILLYLMEKYDFFMFIASRGLGKSYLVAVYCCVKCILFPGIKIIVAAKDKGQAKLMITQKIEKELMNYEGSMLRFELKPGREGIQTGANDAKVVFKNGSTIECTTSGESARGYRGNILIVDEFRLVPKDVLDKILRPFLTVVYNPPFYKKDEYKNHPRFENKEIYMSSAWLKAHDSYIKFKSYINSMLKGESYACVDLPYTVARDEGFLTQARIDAIRNEDDMSEMSWQMEMEGKWFGESESAFYKLGEIEPNRNIKKAWTPPTKEQYILERDKRKKSYHLQKQEGEKRLIGVDIALMQGSTNDNTIFTMMRLIPNGESYDRYIVNIESYEGVHSESQAIRIKQLFDDFQADYIVCDTAGNGLGVYDAMAKVQYDSDRDIEYPPFIAFNDEKMSSRSLNKNGIPCIYSMKVTQAETNHQICTWLKDDLQNNRLKLLINDIEAKSYLSDNHSFDLKTAEEQVNMLKPYLQTSALVNEMVNLEWKTMGIYIKVFETGRNRKDRYSSLSYCNYYARILEKELKKPKKQSGFVAFW